METQLIYVFQFFRYLLVTKTFLIFSGMEAKVEYIICCLGKQLSFQFWPVSHIELFVMSGSAESLMIVDAIAEVTAHPNDNIAAMTFNFWNRLSRVLTGRWDIIEIILYPGCAWVSGKKLAFLTNFIFLLWHLDRSLWRKMFRSASCQPVVDVWYPGWTCRGGHILIVTNLILNCWQWGIRADVKCSRWSGPGNRKRKAASNISTEIWAACVACKSASLTWLAAVWNSGLSTC